MKIIKYCPLMLIVFGLINLAFFFQINLKFEAFSFKLFSQAIIKVSYGDSLLLLGMFLVYFEIFKSTRYIRSIIVDQISSLLIFICFLLEFLLHPPAANIEFLLLGLLSLLDVFAGMTIGQMVSRSHFADN